jgi:hypothetical protein
MKLRKVLIYGGVAAGAYWLLAGKRRGSSLSGLLWNTPTEDAQASRAKLVPLYDSYNKKVGSLPIELSKINPTRYSEAFNVVKRIYDESVAAGDKMMSLGEIVKAKLYYDNGVQELTNLRIPEIDALLTSTPVAVDFYNNKIGLATTAAQVAAVTEAARKLSQAKTVQDARELQVSLASQNEILAQLDKPLAAAEKGLRLVGDPLGIGSGKNFFENMQDFISRMKWYAIGAGAIFVAIKFGPTIMSWVNKAKAGPSVGLASNPRRRRK